MLIDTILIEDSPGETRAALVAGGRVHEVVHCRADRPSLVGATYLGRVVKIDAGLNAAFVDLGNKKPAFLRARDVAPGTGGRIKRLVHEGALIPVQVITDGHGGKSPAVTNRLRFVGRFLDYRPGEAGVSFDFEAGRSKRGRISEQLSSLLSAEEGVVITGPAEPMEAIAQDLDALRARWRAIDARRGASTKPGCLEPAPDPVHRVLSDHMDVSVERVIVSGVTAIARARDWCLRYQPQSLERLVEWRESTLLFEAQGAEAAIDAALAPRVALAGGGELLFESGETLTAVDVNSAGFPGKAGRQALDLNLAAVPEIACQLRLRGIGGAIVIDFLRMAERADRNRVVAALRRALRHDPARCHVLGVSRLGLVELTRQRRGPSLAERFLDRTPAARLRADVLALAALRRLVAQLRIAPAPHVTLAASQEVIDLLRDHLAPACADASDTVGGAIKLVPRADWPRDRFEILPSHTGAA